MSRPWVDHYGAVSGQNVGNEISVARPARRFVLDQMPRMCPSFITTNASNPFTVDSDGVTPRKRLDRPPHSPFGNDEPLSSAGRSEFMVITAPKAA